MINNRDVMTGRNGAAIWSYVEQDFQRCDELDSVCPQIVPHALMAALRDSDKEAGRRAIGAMMTMKKIDIAAIEAARVPRPSGAPGRPARGAGR